MTSPKNRKVYHPYCHLFNGERLYYLLIKNRTLSPTNRNFLLSAAKEVLPENFISTISLHQVFGETDMILRIWASHENLDLLINKLESLPSTEAVTVLLIKEMLTYYQREMEAARNWRWHLPAEQLGDILEHKFPPFLVRNVTEQTDGWIRFFVFCEEPYRTKSDLFERINKVVGDSLKEKNSSLARFSLYSYSNRRLQGVLLKGDLKGDTFKQSSRSLSYLVNEIIKLGCKTTTNICSETILDAHDAVIERAGADDSDVSWTEVMSNLLLSFESKLDDHGPNAHSLNMQSDVDAFSEEHDGEARKVLGALEMRERHKRCMTFAFVASRELWECIKHYHPKWWSVLGEFRLMYRWVAAGSEKSDQIIAVIMKGYADMESELAAKLRKISDMSAFSEMLKISLRQKLSKISKLAENAELLDQICSLKSGGSGDVTHITLEPIAFEMGKLKKSELLKQISEFQQEQWKQFQKALERCVQDRNDLMHGNVRSMFGTVPKDPKHEESSKVVAWQRFTINYLRVLALYPLVSATLEFLGRKAKRHRKKSAQKTKQSAINHA